MSISVFDLFKIGIGPSSSHTVGPMNAAARFLQEPALKDQVDEVVRIKVQLFGSLSDTGVGHATDHAVLLGLAGKQPATVMPQEVDDIISAVKDKQELALNGDHLIAYDYDRDMCFEEYNLDYHANAMTITAYGAGQKVLHANTYYSIGGGFIIDHAESQTSGYASGDEVNLRYGFDSGAEMLALCQQYDLSVSDLMFANEMSWRSATEVREELLQIWQTMQTCVENGLQNEGILPGGLNVRRRAAGLFKALSQPYRNNLIASSMEAMDWLNLYALAVNEENAAGGRVVTAPTNGAAGIIPAVLHYYWRFCPLADEDGVIRFLLAAAAVGTLCKKNASISGAEVGCQGEVGSACAMAAAGLTEALGGTPTQVEHAAEIGLEHNLGLTCDPVGGLVQVPCIERNAIAAVKAVNAAQMALRNDTGHYLVSLDQVIQTMKVTGEDMQAKYKETSRGGLATNVVVC